MSSVIAEILQVRLKIYDAVFASNFLSRDNCANRKETVILRIYFRVMKNSYRKIFTELLVNFNIEFYCRIIARS